MTKLSNHIEFGLTLVVILTAIGIFVFSKVYEKPITKNVNKVEKLQQNTNKKVKSNEKKLLSTH